MFCVTRPLAAEGEPEKISILTSVPLYTVAVTVAVESVSDRASCDVKSKVSVMIDESVLGSNIARVPVPIPLSYDPAPGVLGPASHLIVLAHGAALRWLELFRAGTGSREVAIFVALRYLRFEAARWNLRARFGHR